MWLETLPNCCSVVEIGNLVSDNEFRDRKLTTDDVVAMLKQNYNNSDVLPDRFERGVQCFICTTTPNQTQFREVLRKLGFAEKEFSSTHKINPPNGLLFHIKFGLLFP